MPRSPGTDPGPGFPAGGGVFAAAVVLVVFAVYLASAPRTVVLEDDGLFLLTAWYAGVAHPPGYPLYTMLAALAAKVPFGTVAFRVHALTALCGALACGVMALWLARLLRDRVAAAAAALTFAFTPTFWSQAVVAEVYALNVLLWLLAGLLAWQEGQEGQEGAARPDRVRALGLVAGLGLANHWPLFVLGSLPLALLVPWRRWPGLALRMLPFTCLGLLPYAWLFVRGLAPIEVSTYGPVHSLADLWYYVSRAPYAVVDHDATAGWADKGAFSLALARDLVAQFSVAGAVLALLGLVASGRLLAARTVSALVLAALTGSVGLLLLLDFAWTPLKWTVFRVYPLIPYAAVAMFAGIGVHLVGRRIGRYWRPLLLGLPAALAAVHFGTIQRPNAEWSERFADHVLGLLEPGAVLLGASDVDHGVLGYHLLVEGRRPDVTPLSTHGILLPGRLFLPRTLSQAEQQARVRAFVDSTPRPVFHLDPLDHGHGVRSFGLVKRVERGLPSGVAVVELGPRALAHLDYLLAAGPFPDGFAAQQNATHVAMFAEALAWSLASDPGLADRPEVGTLLERLAARPLAAVVLAEVLAEHAPDGPLAGRADAFAAAAVAASGNGDPALAARGYAVRALLARAAGRSAEADAFTAAGRAAWPHPENPLAPAPGR